jgi:hypothetical protein
MDTETSTPLSLEVEEVEPLIAPDQTADFAAGLGIGIALVALGFAIT